MLKSIFLICLLVGVCLTLDEPFKPTSPTPLSPILKALFKSTDKPAEQLVKDLEETLMDEIPEVTRIICACDSKECKQKKDTIKQDLLTIAEIKQLTEKLESILHKQIFEKIAKRSIEDDEEEEKDENKKLIKMFEKIKNIFDLNDHKQIREFKEKIMGMSEEVVPLKVVIEKFRTSSWSLDSDSLTSDCSKKTKIFCPAGTKIKIAKSTISNKEKDKCPAKHVQQLTKKSDETCTEETKTTKIVKDKCEGQKMCEISVDVDFESVCECTQSKYLNMTYSCEPESETEIDRSKRSVHYRNRPAQIDRDRFLRRIPSPGAAYDYYYYGLPFDYYYGGFGPLDYYYGFGPLDYYGFGPLDYYYGFGPLDYYYGFGPFGFYDYYYDYYPAYGAVVYDY